MRAALDDSPIAQHHDLIGVLHGRDAVGNQHRRPLPQDRIQAAQDSLFGSRIHAGKGIVQDQNFGIADHGAGDGRALLLAAGERDAALADHGVEFGGELIDFSGDAGDLGGIVNLLVGGVIDAEGEVFAQGLAEQESVLRHVTHRPPQRFERPFPNRTAIDQQRSRRRVPEPRDQRGQRGFPAPRGADDREDRTRRNMQGNILQDRLVDLRRSITFCSVRVASHGGIGKRQIPEFNFAADFRCFPAAASASLIFGSESRM